MKIEIRQAKHFSKYLADYVEKKVYFAFGRFSRNLKSIKVSLKDLNGPKGGIDKRCQFMVKLKRKVLVLESIEKDFYSAVDVTVDRMANRISRELDKNLTLRHKSFGF